MVYLPLWKIWVRQLGWWNSQYMESHKIHVPNHQSELHLCLRCFEPKHEDLPWFTWRDIDWKHRLSAGHELDTKFRSNGWGWVVENPSLFVTRKGNHMWMDFLAVNLHFIIFYRGFSIAAVFVTICLSWFSGDNPISTQKLPWPNQPGITQRSQPSVLV